MASKTPGRTGALRSSSSTQGSSASLRGSNSSLNIAPSTADRDVAERAKQASSRRDEALRKKADAIVSKSKYGGDLVSPSASGAASFSRQRVEPGTVAALKPTLPLLLPEHLTVFEAANHMAAKKTDAIIVVDQMRDLSGICTDKDIAFRVIAEGLDPRSVKLMDIMTPNPSCVTPESSAQAALQRMAKRHFRHLPVVSHVVDFDDGEFGFDEGVVDGEADRAASRRSSSVRELNKRRVSQADSLGEESLVSQSSVMGVLDIAKCTYEAVVRMERAAGGDAKSVLAGLAEEWRGNAEVAAALESLRSKMVLPTLAEVLEDGSCPAIEVGPRSSVRDAAKAMKAARATAVVIREGAGNGVVASGAGTVAGIFTTKDVVLRVVGAGLNADTTSLVRVMTPNPQTFLPSLTVLEALKIIHEKHFLHLPVVDPKKGLLGMVDVMHLTLLALEKLNAVEGGGSQTGSNHGGNEGPMWNRFFASIGDISGGLSDHDGASQPDIEAESSQTGRNHRRRDSASSSVSQPNHGAGTSSEVAAAAAAAVAAPPAPLVFKFKDSSGIAHRLVWSTETDGDLPALLATLRQRAGGVEGPITWQDEDGDWVALLTDSDLAHAQQVAARMFGGRINLRMEALVPAAPQVTQPPRPVTPTVPSRNEAASVATTEPQTPVKAAPTVASTDFASSVGSPVPVITKPAHAPPTVPQSGFDLNNPNVVLGLAAAGIAVAGILVGVLLAGRSGPNKS